MLFKSAMHHCQGVRLHTNTHTYAHMLRQTQGTHTLAESNAKQPGWQTEVDPPFHFIKCPLNEPHSLIYFARAPIRRQ